MTHSPSASITFVDRDEKATRELPPRPAPMIKATPTATRSTGPSRSRPSDSISSRSRWPAAGSSRRLPSSTTREIGRSSRLRWDPFPAGSGKVASVAYTTSTTSPAHAVLPESDTLRGRTARLETTPRGSGSASRSPHRRRVGSRSAACPRGPTPRWSATSTIQPTSGPSMGRSSPSPMGRVPWPASISRSRPRTRLYGRALYQDGAPVYPGSWIAWFEKYDQAKIVAERRPAQGGPSPWARSPTDHSASSSHARSVRTSIKTTGGKVEIHGEGGERSQRTRSISSHTAPTSPSRWPSPRLPPKLSARPEERALPGPRRKVGARANRRGTNRRSPEDGPLRRSNSSVRTDGKTYRLSDFR